jgi:actin related protein 2/3 complex subunit 2
MAAAKGRVFLQPANRIIEEAVAARVGPDAIRAPTDITACDFDGVQLHLVVAPEAMNIVRVSISMRCMAELRRAGADEMVDALYAPYKTAEPEPGYDLTFAFDVDALPEDPDTVIKKMSLLRRNLFCAPFEKAFAALADGSPKSVGRVMLPYRKSENVWLIPHSDRIVVIFLVAFEDSTDQALARIFLQEFVEAQRRVRAAPPVQFSRDVPMELTSERVVEPASFVGYVSFAMLPRHVAGDKLEKAATLVAGFRAYLLYHVKASKSYLHTRMRLRVDSLLSVLRRAIPDTSGKKKKAGAAATGEKGGASARFRGARAAARGGI